MNEYKIIFEDGDYMLTRFNGTADEAKAYYLGRVFNLGTERDRLVRCVAVEQLGGADDEQ